jgi:hypothetical protein
LDLVLRAAAAQVQARQVFAGSTLCIVAVEGYRFAATVACQSCLPCTACGRDIRKLAASVLVLALLRVLPLAQVNSVQERVLAALHVMAVEVGYFATSVGCHLRRVGGASALESRGHQVAGVLVVRAIKDGAKTHATKKPLAAALQVMPVKPPSVATAVRT